MESLKRKSAIEKERRLYNQASHHFVVGKLKIMCCFEFLGCLLVLTRLLVLLATILDVCFIYADSSFCKAGWEAVLLSFL